MGACGSRLTEEEKEEMRRAAELDELMEAEEQEQDAQIKLLLLGAGESGKSTVFKQMKILYKKGFTEDELRDHIPTIHSNILASTKSLVCNGRDFQFVNLEHPLNEIMDKYSEMAEDHPLNPDDGVDIARIWADEQIQVAYENRAKFQLNDSTKLYLDDLDRLTSKEYMPTEQDVLRSRVRTSGIVEDIYLIDEIEFRMFDVGGQRNERRKWIHCFDGVTAIIFVAALSEYDQVLFEDASQNRMDEALQLFDEICNSRWFTKTSMILFLNKKDLFEAKIQKVDIRCEPCEEYPNGRFMDYEGGLDYDNGKKYFDEKFCAVNMQENKEIYSHACCATDTENVSRVFNASKDIILKGNLSNSGFM